MYLYFRFFTAFNTLRNPVKLQGYGMKCFPNLFDCGIFTEKEKGNTNLKWLDFNHFTVKMVHTDRIYTNES